MKQENSSLQFSFKINDLEVMACNEHLMHSEHNTTAEIVKLTDNDSCYTIAYWLKTNEGFDLKFVSNRPFQKNIKKKIFWKLAKPGQKTLEGSLK